LTFGSGGLPFPGYDGTKGTFVLRGRWKHNDAATAYMLGGDTSSTAFVYQVTTDGTSLRATDGTGTIEKTAVFTDDTDITSVMSWLESGAFNILADGSAEATASLTGDMATPTISIGSLNGANGMLGTIESITYYPTQLTLAERQALT